MTKREAPTQEAFDKLLIWLDPNREKAANKYQKIQTRLIGIFSAKGCYDAEDLADETFNVVALKIDWLIANYVGDPAFYFYAVARKIFLEDLKRRRPPPEPPPAPDNSEIERKCICLERCLNQELTPSERTLLDKYHEKDKQEKIDTRKQLAAGLGISINALRIKIYHYHSRLRSCIEPCLKQLSD